MRKRKSPIALVSFLALVVVGITGYNFATSRVGTPAQQAPAPEVENTNVVGQARPATPAASVSQSLHSAMGAATGSPASHAGGPPPGAPGSGPMILGPSMSAKPEKPKPNSSSTSAQWYNSESSMSGQKG